MLTPPASWLRIPADALPRLAAALGAERSPYETALLLRDLGFALGGALGEAFETRLADRQGAASPATLDTHEFWESLSSFFEETGWGALRFDQLHEGVGALRTDGWADRDGHLSTGVLAEMLSRAAGSEVAVMNAADPASGDARFLFGSPETLQSVYEHWQQTGTVASAIERLG